MDKEIKCPMCSRLCATRQEGFIEDKKGKKVVRIYGASVISIKCENCGNLFVVDGNVSISREG